MLNKELCGVFYAITFRCRAVRKEFDEPSDTMR